MMPLTREVAADYDGPFVTCPSCSARITIDSHRLEDPCSA